MRYAVITSAAVAVLLVAFGAPWLLRSIRLRRGSTEDTLALGRTRDARGRSVRLIDPLPLYALRRHDVIDAEALEPIIEELEPGVRGRRRFLWLSLGIAILALIGVGAGVAAGGRPAWDDLVSTLLNPAIMGGVIGGAVVPWVITRQERLKRVKGIMLRHRRCPHCGYGLTGVPSDSSDGATVCPECAAAWCIGDDEADTTPTAVPASGARSGLLLGLLAALTGLAMLGGVLWFMMQ